MRRPPTEKKVKKTIDEFQTASSSKQSAIFDLAGQFEKLFNEEIFTELYGTPLSKAVFSLKQPRRRSPLGTYSAKSGVGFGNKITIFEHLQTMENPTFLACIIFHELCHEYQDLYDPRPTRTRFYHDRRFCAVSEKWVPTDEKGHFGGMTQEFYDLLDRAKIMPYVDERLILGSEFIEKLRINPKPPRKDKQDTKMKRWVCGCEIIVRCAVALNATCNVCQKPFRRREVVMQGRPETKDEVAGILCDLATRMPEFPTMTNPASPTEPELKAFENMAEMEVKFSNGILKIPDLLVILTGQTKI